MRSSRTLGSTVKTYGLFVALGATTALLIEKRAVAEKPAFAPVVVEAPAEIRVEAEPGPVATPPARRPAFSRVVNAAGLVLVIAAVVLWALFLRPQSLGGPAAYVLVSGKSMLPRYHTGDLVLVERQSHYHVGQVIAYRVPKGDPMAGAQVIHRIIGGDAQHGFVVQGDNRTAPDVWRPKPSDIVGAKAVRFPSAVVVLQYLRSPLLLALMAASFVFVRVLGFGGGGDGGGNDGEKPEAQPGRRDEDGGDAWLAEAA
jgi:signal peptidase